ncbi:MAG: RNA polymerase sigma factor [Gammaproteobacteria bacterium]
MPESSSSTLPKNRGLRAVFLTCRSTLTRTVGRIVNRREVDDILQEAFTRSYEAAGKATVRNARAFLVRTANNLALNPTSSTGSRLGIPIEDLPLQEFHRLTAESLESRSEANLRFVAYSRAVGALPEECRRALILKKVYGLSQQDIAERLGIKPITVEQYIAQGLLMCRDYMESLGAPLDGGEGTDSRKSASRHRP